MLNTEVRDFIHEKRVCVFAAEMPDGSPHAAVVNFACQEDPLQFVIQTDPTSRKATLISAGHN